MTLNTSHVVATGACIAACGVVLLAGPLSPPEGPIRSTQLALDTIEPRTPLTNEFVQGDEQSMFRVTRGGHYYLTGDIFVEEGKSGIVVETSRVTIDLNGYFILGRNGSLDSIVGERADLIIRNGTINSKRVGIDLDGSIGRTLIENVTIADSDQDGIIARDDVTIRDCVIRTSGVGVTIGDRARIERSTVVAQKTGISARREAIIRDNSIEAAAEGAVEGVAFGIRAIENSIVDGNTVRVERGFGIDAERSTITNNILASGEVGQGIVGSGITSGNVVNGYAIGINQHNGLVKQNYVTNTASTGIVAGGTLVEGNAVIVARDTGIVPSDHTTVRGNSITQDENHEPTDGSTKGISVAGRFAVIEDNTLSRLGFGVWGGFSFSIVRGNTTMEVFNPYPIMNGPGDAVGPIDVFGGNSEVIASESPFANFDFKRSSH